MGRPRWRRLRLLAACLLSLLLTVITVLLSELLMTPGLARNLVQNCAPNIGDLITLLLLLHLTQRPNRPDEDNGPAGPQQGPPTATMTEPGSTARVLARRVG